MEAAASFSPAVSWYWARASSTSSGRPEAELTRKFQFSGGSNNIVKLRQGSGKVRQGKARKGKDGER